MNETQVRTVEQMREVLSGTQALQFQPSGEDAARYGWIGAVLKRVSYRQLKRAERGVVRAYLEHFSGYSRAQLTRLVSRWVMRKSLVKQYRAPGHAFARRYTAADVVLLAQVDTAMDTLSGPATACVLRRQRDVFGDARFARLGSISPAHLYNLRHSGAYRARRVLLTKTQPTMLMAARKCTSSGEVVYQPMLPVDGAGGASIADSCTRHSPLQFADRAAGGVDDLRL